MNNVMLKSSAALAALACLNLIAPPTAIAAERWFLMSRHGDCAPIESLKRKVPDLGEISDPDAFVSFMRQKGYQVTSTVVPVPNGKAQEVNVPQQGLALIFVTSEMCQRQSTR